MTSERRAGGSRRRARTAAVAAVAAAAGLLGTAGLPGTAAAAGGTGATAARTTTTIGTTSSAATTSGPRRITLITGDVLTTRPGPAGGTVGSVVHAATSGPAARLDTVRDHGHTYTFPVTALPYLGHQLDRGLFDVTSRGQARHDQQVVLTYRSGHHHSAVPGITATGSSGDTVTGKVTSPTAFGRALAAQFAKDHDSDTHTGGLFADLASVAPATGATPPAAHPDFPMHTLTINAVGRDGKKAGFASAGIWNMTDIRRYASFPFVEGGLAKVSVPSGPYFVLVQFFDDDFRSSYLVAVPTTKVTKATSITVDARTATSRLSATTPRPASLEQIDYTFVPRDARGSLGGFGSSGDASPVWYAPTKKRPATGDLLVASGFQFRSPASASPGYDYTLRYRNVHTVAADQSYSTPAMGLATVDAAYAGDGTGVHGFDAAFGFFRWEFGGFTSDFDLVTPAHRTNYYNSGPGLAFSRDWTQYFDEDTFDFLGSWGDTFRTYRPGQHASTTWARQPLHPRLSQRKDVIGQTVCPACRDGRTVDLAVNSFGDNDPGHFGYSDYPAKGLTEKVAYTLTADGRTVASGSGDLIGNGTMPKGAKTYGFGLDTTRRKAGLFKLSDVTSTRWTVPAKASKALPGGWLCLDENYDRHCTVMPLITNSYDLPVNLHGELASGATKGGLDLGHLAGAKANLTQVSVEVSYDGGDTWKQAEITGGTGGHYGLAFTVPAKAHTDGYGAVRLTAKDTAGSTLTQTVHRAFAVR